MKQSFFNPGLHWAAGLAVALAICGFSTPAAGKPLCVANNGGIDLPPGFCAVVVAESSGRARHLAVRDNGDIYLRLKGRSLRGSLVALRDADGDGRAEVVERFGPLTGGTGIAIGHNRLYFSTDRAVYRYSLAQGELLPRGRSETVVEGFPMQFQHAAKSIALGGEGGLYVNVGAPSNACQKRTRSPGSPGIDPCPQLETQGAIWHFNAAKTATQFKQGERFATGIRNAVALAWNPQAKKLFAVQHGRDQLHGLWPEIFSEKQNAELPAEEFFRITKGDDFGWPYCYYDPIRDKKVLAPDYGGDGETVGRCIDVRDPIVAFPGHWAPNGLMFYTGDQFPSRYRDGAFIAFHGSWNRAPLAQQGYKVVFVPFHGASPAGDWEDFATGFAGAGVIRSSSDARFRPMGLAQGPDGSLYISDSVQGRIWRVIYRGGEEDKNRTGPSLNREQAAPGPGDATVSQPPPATPGTPPPR